MRRLAERPKGWASIGSGIEQSGASGDKTAIEPKLGAMGPLSQGHGSAFEPFGKSQLKLFGTRSDVASH